MRREKPHQGLTNTHAASSVGIAEFVSEPYLEISNNRENEGFETG
jgi:hypothetical protein